MVKKIKICKGYWKVTLIFKLGYNKHFSLQGFQINTGLTLQETKYMFDLKKAPMKPKFLTLEMVFR